MEKYIKDVNKMVTDAGTIAIAAALAVGLAGIAAGLAEATIGKCAVQVMKENPKFFGKALLFTVIPESIAIFGLVTALIMLFVFNQ
jgi:V/A-type H+-transporting ATPase subunit K